MWGIGCMCNDFFLSMCKVCRIGGWGGGGGGLIILRCYSLPYSPVHVLLFSHSPGHSVKIIYNITNITEKISKQN